MSATPSSREAAIFSSFSFESAVTLVLTAFVSVVCAIGEHWCTMFPASSSNYFQMACIWGGNLPTTLHGFQLVICARLWPIGPALKTIKNEEIKARIDGAMKTELWTIATARGLDMSDIIREALREFIRVTHQPKVA